MEVAAIYLVAAFACALAAVYLRLPPLVGFLVAGFVLAALDVPYLEGIDLAADLGVTLLLFGIGLKLDVRTLLRREVVFTSVAHMVIFTVIGAGFVKLLLLLGLPGLGSVSGGGALAIAFALSFSSTVVVVKVLEERGESQAFYGRLAVGILVIQDIAAVVFLAASEGHPPSVWALSLVLLWPLSLLLRRVWSHLGHGEMQALFGLFIAFVPGYALFELVGLKGDLGALVMGMLLAHHRAASDLGRQLTNIKDLLLVGFFLEIGLAGVPSLVDLAVAGVLLVLAFVQGWGYALLLRLSQITRHTTSRVGLAMAQFSEFGLIVTAVAVEMGLVEERWLTIIAVAVAASFVLSAAANRTESYADRLALLLPPDPPVDRLHPECRPLALEGADALVLGMGRVGQGAAHQLVDEHRLHVLGVEQNPDKLLALAKDGLKAIEADASDITLWDGVVDHPRIQLVVIALPSHEVALDILGQLRQREYTGRIAAVARYPEHEAELRAAGADVVTQIYGGAGAQLADDAYTPSPG